MKKIITLVLAMVMIASFSVVASADTYPAVVTVSSAEVEVGAAGTATLNLTATFAEETVVGMVAWTFDLPEGVEITSYNIDAWKAYFDTTVTDDSALPTITVYEDDMNATIPAGTVITIPVTFSFDTSAANVFTIGADGSNSMILDADMNFLNDQENFPSATITVAAPVIPDPVPVNKYDVDFDEATELVAGDVKYINVAIYDATFVGLETKGATQIGYDLIKGEVNNGEVITTEISGDGEVKFALALYNITAEQKAGLTFAPYYTVMEVPAE